MPDPSSIDYSTATYADIQSRIGYLQTQSTLSTDQQNEIVNGVDKLQQRLNANRATDLQISNDELNRLKDQIVEAQKDLKIAEDRVATLRHPEKDRSYYESWFPVNRPLTNRTVFIVLAIGVFFFILSLLIILKTFGVGIQVSMPWDNPALVAGVKGFIPPIIGNNISSIIVGLLILFIVLYATKTYA